MIKCFLLAALLEHADSVTTMSHVNMSHIREEISVIPSDIESVKSITRKENFIQAGENVLSNTQLLSQITAYLSVSGVYNLALTNEQIMQNCRLTAAKFYAQFIQKNKTVSYKSLDILRNIRGDKEKEQLTNLIISEINSLSGDAFYRTRSIPPFLMPYFTLATDTFFDCDPAMVLHVLNGNVCSSDTTKISLLHSKIREKQHEYIRFADMVQSGTIDKHRYIIVNHDEFLSNSQLGGILDTFFRKNQKLELIIDFGDIIQIDDDFGQHRYNGFYYHFSSYIPSSYIPNGVRHIHIIGKNLKKIGNRFLNNCHWLNSITFPHSIKKVGYDFLSSTDTLNLYSVAVSDQVLNYLRKNGDSQKANFLEGKRKNKRTPHSDSKINPTYHLGIGYKF